MLTGSGWGGRGGGWGMGGEWGELILGGVAIGEERVV
jgi:hypothetical protein